METQTIEKLRTLLTRWDLTGVKDLLESEDTCIPNPDQLIDFHGIGTEESILFKACEAYVACDGLSDLSSIEILLKKYKANANTQNIPEGYTPLLLAVGENQLPLLECLMNHCQADLEVRYGAEGITLLMRACSDHTEEAEDIVKFLLEKGANINAVDEHGRTVLHFAASDGSPAIVQLVLDHLALTQCLPLQLEAQSHGYTNLHASLQRPFFRGEEIRREEIVRLLLESGADPNARRGIGEHPMETPIMCATSRGNTACAKTLVEFRANAHAIGPDGMTTLHMAAQHGHVQMIELLTTLGLDCFAKNAANRTPIEVAKSYRKEAVEAVFVRIFDGLLKRHYIFRNTILRGAHQETCLLRILPILFPNELLNIMELR